MRVVLLALNSNTRGALETLARHYPHAEIKEISRQQFEAAGGLTARLNSLRAMRPDVFAVFTERLAWQRGQNLFLLFGALAGAGHSLVMDNHGAVRKESRASILLQAPGRLANDSVQSAAALTRSRLELLRLEKQVKLERLAAVRSAKGAVRVVYLRATPGPGTQAGGAASHIRGVVDALAGLGADVSVISNDTIAGMEQSKAKVVIIEPQSSGGPRALFDIQSNLNFTRGVVPLVDGDPPDFIYQRYARFNWSGVVAMLHTKRPLFLEYNGSEVWVGRHWDHVGMLNLLARFELLNLAAAARIFVVSEVERRNLEQSGLASSKIIVNPNGVDTEVFRPGVGGGKVRRELGVNNDEVVVGFVGTFGPWHGVLTLAEAIKTVPSKTSVRFLLVGSGALHNQVMQLLRSEHENGRVIFTGAVDHERVPALLDACDVLVAPHVPLADGSPFFGSPTKLFEYMAMGKGIVASRLGQIGDVLTHEETALLVEPGDAAALTEAIVRLVESPELREHLGKEAREIAVRSYTWKHNAQRVLDAYRSWAENSEQ
jgi:glycosyltransferase involved in cell wall biosynthesis